MAFDFPASPAEGQIFSAPGGPTYVFNSPVWKAVGQGQIAIISDTPPASPANGALWYESDSGILFIWYNDGNSSQWVQVGGIQAGAPPPPASDNAEYVMVNGVWRLKSQKLPLAGLVNVDIACPDWASGVHLDIWHGTGSGATTTVVTFSYDGTNFMTVSGDYYVGGFQHSSGTGGFAGAVLTAVAGMTLTNSGNSATMGMIADMTVRLDKVGTDAARFWWRGNVYNNAAGVGVNTMIQNGYVNNANCDRVRKIRLAGYGAAAFSTGAAVVEWLP